MFVRTIDLAATDSAVKLQSGEKLPPGWYMFRAGFNPNDLAEYGGVTVYIAESGVSSNASMMMVLNASESQIAFLDKPVEVMFARSAALKCRCVVTEV